MTRAEEEAAAAAGTAAAETGKAAAKPKRSMGEAAQDILKTVTSGQLSWAFWQALLVIGVLYMARFELSFVSLRLASINFPKELIPIIMTVNTWIQVWMGSSPPRPDRRGAGRLTDSDAMDPRGSPNRF